MEKSIAHQVEEPLRLLWENHSADIRHGATVDGLDLARFSDREKLQVVFCGPESVPLDDAIESLGCQFLPAVSRQFSRSGLIPYGLNVWAWMRRLREHRIDAVFLNYASWGPSMAYAAKRLGIPVLARAGGKYDSKNLTYRWVDKYLANCVQQSSGLAGSLAADRVVEVGSFIDISSARSNLEAGVLPARRSGVPLILYVGQLVDRKGIHILVEALKGLDKTVDIWLVGGDWKNPGYPTKIRSEAESIPGDCHVHFVNHRPDVLKLISTCDIFVLPSLSEARPRVIMEAMLLGKCVVATNVGGVPTLLVNNETGKLVQPNNAVELGEALRELIATPSLRIKLGQAALKHAQASFDSKATAKRYLSEIRELVRNKGC